MLMNEDNNFTYLAHFTVHDTVLVAPLNWGLGHASRCIPIIQELINRNIKVIIASDGIALDLLKNEFPGQTFVTLPNFDIKYGKALLLKIFQQSPKILYTFYSEHKSTIQIINDYKISHIISDNRYAVRNRAIPSYIIIHQIQLIVKIPFVQFVARKINQYLINKFDQCWIPDFNDSKLAGSLSNSIGLNNPIYIGPLSRLKVNNYLESYIDICVILSGPEPLRTELENILIKLLSNTLYTFSIIRGTSNTITTNLPKNCQNYINIANCSQIENSINSSNIIITRSGYSTIMDLDGYDKPVIMIPTPGQTEQEYLAKRLKTPNYTLSQKDLTDKLIPLIEQIL